MTFGFRGNRSVFGRKRHEVADPPRDDSCPQLRSGPLSIGEAFAAVHSRALRHDPSARLYLLLSDDVNSAGQAGEWRIMYLLPRLHGEAGFRVRAGLGGPGQVHELVTPYPEPGSTEDMLGSYSPEGARINEMRWQKRLSMLRGLPIPFIEAAVAIEAMQSQGAILFSGGPLHLKGRMLPDTTAVWEATNSIGVWRVPLAAHRS